MARTWVLDTDTKGTGARMVPLEDVLQKPEPKPRTSAPRRAPQQPSPERKPDRARPTRAARRSGGEKRLTPLPPGHVRKKTTGEIGRVKALDPKAGTVTVSWLREGRVSTVPISSVTRK